ncbi:hypothetical protein ACFL3C_01300 [Patescibacteria group bacterium]
MNSDSLSDEELDQLRSIWEKPLENVPQAPQEASAKIAESISIDVKKASNISIPEKREDQLESLSAISEAFIRIVENSNNLEGCKQSVQNFEEIVNDQQTIKRLGDKVRTVLNFIVTRSNQLIKDVEEGKEGAFEAFELFIKGRMRDDQSVEEQSRIGDIQIGLDGVIKQKTKVEDKMSGEMRMPPDPTPLEIKTLEALLNGLRIPYSPIDVIKIFKEEDQQETFELAFRNEEEELDKEMMSGLLRSKAILRKCKEEGADPEVEKDVEEEVGYWKNMTELDFFPGERRKKLKEYYRFKNMLRNFDMVKNGEVPYDEMLELYRKLKPKSKRKNDDEANA